MRCRLTGIALLAAPWLASSSTIGAESASAQGAPRSIGTMTAFWRHRPVLGRWLKGRLGLTEVPAYLCDSELSFSYRRRPYPEEVLFADHLTVVRLLGGWKLQKGKGEQDGGKGADLCYRGDDGGIRYRWGLLGPRLDHYVHHGYDLTIVLDNTPWDLPADPIEGSGFGQSAPPADFAEWGHFIEELCRQLVKLYGVEAVSRWRFRMGTECQGTERFSGTQEQFFRLYDHAAAAVKRVLPAAAFGPFNLAGGPDTGNVRYSDLAEHCVNGTNHATGDTGSPLDIASVSIYTAPSVLRGILRTTDPTFKAQQKVDFWNGLVERHSGLADISREVHEFGILGNEFGVGHGEPGARGAAWMFHVMVCLREGGLDRLWNWGVMEGINLGEHRQVLQGSGWLFSVLEHTVGGETFVLQPQIQSLGKASDTGVSELNHIATYVRPVELSRPGRSFWKSIAVVRDRRAFIITSAYHEDRFVTAAAGVTVSLPRSLVEIDELTRVSQVELTRTGALYTRMRQDLAAAGLLDERFAAIPGLLGTIKDMGGRRAWSYVDAHWPRYEAIIKDSLMLKPFAGTVTSDERQRHLSFQAAAPSVTVIVIDG